MSRLGNWKATPSRRRTADGSPATSSPAIEAARCDRLALLDHGRVVAQGTPDALTSEIGGDVVTVQSEEPEALAADIAARFGGGAAVLDGSIRLESPAGHA